MSYHHCLLPSHSPLNSLSGHVNMRSQLHYEGHPESWWRRLCDILCKTGLLNYLKLLDDIITQRRRCRGRRCRCRSTVLCWAWWTQSPWVLDANWLISRDIRLYQHEANILRPPWYAASVDTPSLHLVLNN